MGEPRPENIEFAWHAKANLETHAMGGWKTEHGEAAPAASNLWVVLTDFNGATQTRQCLAALSGSLGCAPQVVVVDHGTNSETAELLTREFPHVTRVEASSALWWTGAINAGIQFARSAGATRIVLLNNDCYVQPDTLFHLTKLSEKNPDAIIASVQRDLQSQFIESLTITCNFLLGFPTRPGVISVSKAQLAQGLIPTRLIQGGRGALIPIEIFRKVGLFDSEAFPHYGADHDFYLRAHAAGVPLYVSLHALVDVDTTRTSSAANPTEISFSQFRDSLRSIRSHRSIRHVSPLFRRHFPIPYLYRLGVFLFAARYSLKYVVGRIFSTMGK